jgi:hypothetical protein
MCLKESRKVEPRVTLFFVFWVAFLNQSLNPLQVAQTDANSRKQVQEFANKCKKKEECHSRRGSPLCLPDQLLTVFCASFVFLVWVVFSV